MEAIQWNTLPDYDGWGYDSSWNGNDWIDWYYKLLSHYGNKDQAQNIWVDAWLSGVNSTSGGKGTAEGSGVLFDSVPIDDRSFNTEFRNFANAEGNEKIYNAVFIGMGGKIGGVVSGSVDVVENVASNAADSVKNVSSGIENITTALKYILPVLTIIGTVILVVNLSKIKLSK